MLSLIAAAARDLAVSNCRLALAFLVARSQDKVHLGRVGQSRGGKGRRGLHVEAGWSWLAWSPVQPEPQQLS